MAADTGNEDPRFSGLEDEPGPDIKKASSTRLQLLGSNPSVHNGDVDGGSETETISSGSEPDLENLSLEKTEVSNKAAERTKMAVEKESTGSKPAKVEDPRVRPMPQKIKILKSNDLMSGHSGADTNNGSSQINDQVATLVSSQMEEQSSGSLERPDDATANPGSELKAPGNNGFPAKLFNCFVKLRTLEEEKELFRRSDCRKTRRRRRQESAKNNDNDEAVSPRPKSKRRKVASDTSETDHGLPTKREPVGTKKRSNRKSGGSKLLPQAASSAKATFVNSEADASPVSHRSTERSGSENPPETGNAKQDMSGFETRNQRSNPLLQPTSQFFDALGKKKLL